MKNSKRKKRRRLKRKKMKWEAMEKKVSRKRKEKLAFLDYKKRRKEEFLKSLEKL